MKITESLVYKQPSLWPTWCIKVIGETGYTIKGQADSESAAEATRLRFEREIKLQPPYRES